MASEAADRERVSMLDAAMNEDDADASPLPPLMGKRGAPDPRPKGRPGAEPDLPPTGKRPAALQNLFPRALNSLRTRALN